MDKKILALVTAALGLSATVVAQEPISPLTHLLHARQAMSLQAYAGVVESLAPLYKETWSMPIMGEEALYLDAIARSSMGAEEADLRLLHFIEQHPHSALLPYAQSRLGEWYYVRGDYSGAVYWLDRTDVTALPEERAQAIDYYHAYSLMKTGSEEAALKLFLPLTYSRDFHSAADFYGGYLLLKSDRASEGEKLLSGLYSNTTYGTEALAYVAESRLSQEDFEGALTLAQRGLKRDATESGARHSLLHTAGLAAAMTGRIDLSTDYLRQYMRQAEQPGRIDLLVLGKNLYELGHETEAIGYLTRVDDGTPDFMSQLSHYYLGLTNLSSGKSSSALSSFDRAAEIDVYAPLTEDAQFNGALAAYAAHQGRIGAGTKRFASYLRRYPTGAYRSKVITHLSDAFLNDPKRADVLREISSISPLPPELRRVREKVKLGEANQSLAGGDLRKATEQYGRIIGKNEDPESVAEAYLWRGEAAYRKGDYKGAISDTRAYLDNRPESLRLNPQAYYTLGYAYFNNKNYDQAKSAFQTYLSQTTPSTNERTAVLNRLGDISVQERRLSEAADYFDQAARTRGAESDYGFLHRGIVLGLQKDYEGKISLLSRMQQTFPSSSLLAEGFYELGQTYSMLNRQSLARQAYDRVVTNYPRHELAPSAAVQKALTYMSEESFSEAADAYVAVIRSYPKSDAAKTALENLKALSIQLNRVDEYNSLVRSIGGTAAISDREMDEMTYLAADKIVSEGKPAEAIRALDDYLTRFPSGAYLDKALYSKALILSSNKRHREATPILERLAAMQLEPTMSHDVQLLLLENYERSDNSARAAEVALRLANESSTQADRSRYISAAAIHAQKSQSYDFLLALADDVSRSKWDLTPQTKSEVMTAAAARYDQVGKKDMARLYARAVLQLPASVQTTAARVLTAEELYDQGQFRTVRDRMEKVVGGQSDSRYWLARAILLLSDSYVRLGDKSTAKTYLESLRSGYKDRQDGIIDQIDERLSRL